MIRLSKPQILLLHEQLIAETGGSSGLRDEGMLDSALNAPFQTFGGEDIYPSLQQKAARLWSGKKPSLCRREQAYRRTRHVGVPRLKRDRITAYANRIVRCHPTISSWHYSIF